MDPIVKAKMWRARGMLEELAGVGGPSVQEKAAAFDDLAFVVMQCEDKGEERRRLEQSPNHLVKEATAAHAFGDDAWGGGEVAALAAAKIETIAQESLLDTIALYAPNLPNSMRRPLIATAWVADVVAEGDPKPVIAQGLNIADDIEPIKSAAILVLSQELMRIGGEAVRRLFESELRKAVVRGTNEAVLNLLVDSSTPSASDLAGAMALAGPSMGFVIAMNAGEVAALAVSNTNPSSNLGVRGGTLCPGVHIVAIDDLAQTVVIPASRLALRDWGLQVRGAGHASVQMRTDPLSQDTELVSLWQTNSYGLLCEREFILSGDFSGVVVVEE